ncbi:MAG: response regulator [Eubacterium sp.]|nr:response regulator [Eubacterium sp.]
MSIHFGETLKKLRTQKGLSQQELADTVFVTRSTVARWESGSRMPDARRLPLLASSLGVNVDTLLNAEIQASESPVVIWVEDINTILKGGIPVIERTIPGAKVIGFTRPSEAVEYAKTHRVSLAILDVELGSASGLDLCRKLLEINPQTNVIYLTAYVDYSFDAWGTGASGFMLKPLTEESLKEQLGQLRYPIV